MSPAGPELEHSMSASRRVLNRIKSMLVFVRFSQKPLVQYIFMNEIVTQKHSISKLFLFLEQKQQIKEVEVLILELDRP